jgi:hypothetical protein
LVFMAQGGIAGLGDEERGANHHGPVWNAARGG